LRSHSDKDSNPSGRKRASHLKRKFSLPVRKIHKHVKSRFNSRKRPHSSDAAKQKKAKQPGKPLNVRSISNAVFAVLIIAAVVFLGVVAFGVLDTGVPTFVDGMEYPAGGFYFSGLLKNGYFNDNGFIRFDDGDTYIGGFTDGRFDGEAVYNGGVGADGDWSFDGVFQTGRIGSGVFYLNDGTAVVFDNSKNITDYISQSWQYSGGLNERGQNGMGRFTFEDGSVYTGDFMNGLAFGEGVLTDASGNTVYYGEFVNGLFDGQGVYYSAEGWIYQGNFKNGLFDGEGIVFIDDTVVNGVWEKGVQIIRYD